MKKCLPLLLLLILAVTATPAKAQPSNTYYELVELSYTINADRTLNAHEKYVVYNSSTRTYTYEIKLQIATDEIYDINVWSDAESLDNYEVEKTAEKTTITIRFKLGGRKRLTYHISYIADNLVSGAGPIYEGKFGGIILGPRDFSHQKHIVEIQGLAGSKLFLTNPDAQILEGDPPTVRYETSIDAPGSFDGLEVQFCTQPTYYKLTLTERLTNQSTDKIDDMRLNMILFTEEASWQFAALTSSNYQVKTMYVDNENNWHGVFEVGEISPGATKELQLELIYEIDVYDPRISENDVGELSEASWLTAYLEPDNKWESDHPLIVQAATSAVDGETNAYLAGQKIIKFVVDRLNYQTQTTRHGALWAYLNRMGDCSEYTDLSIALARAAGLPARAMYGWGYSKDNLGGHAWVEFYLPNKGWQPADPTWAETSGDHFVKLNPIHLTRGIRGLNSSESNLTFAYRGASPEFKETVNSLILTASGAAQEYINAAEYAIVVAEKLLADSPSENLSERLQLAQQNLEQAQTASDETPKILYAKQSIENANEVIRALGKLPEETEFFIDWDTLLPVLSIACVIVVVVLSIYVIRKGV